MFPQWWLTIPFLIVINNFQFSAPLPQIRAVLLCIIFSFSMHWKYCYLEWYHFKIKQPGWSRYCGFCYACWGWQIKSLWKSSIGILTKNLLKCIWASVFYWLTQIAPVCHLASYTPLIQIEINSLSCDHSTMRMQCENTLQAIVKRFFNEKEVTSTLVMDALFSGCKQLEDAGRQSESKKVSQLIKLLFLIVLCTVLSCIRGISYREKRSLNSNDNVSELSEDPGRLSDTDFQSAILEDSLWSIDWKGLARDMFV